MPFLEHADASAPSAGSSSEKGFDVCFRAQQAGPQLSTGDPGERSHRRLDWEQEKERPSPTVVLWPAIPGDPALTKWTPKASVTQAKDPRDTGHSTWWRLGTGRDVGAVWEEIRNQQWNQTPASRPRWGH